MSTEFSNSDVLFEKDRPLTAEDVSGEGKRERDRLHRFPFAQQLAEAVSSYVETSRLEGWDDGLVIGLEGSWGSGKTSLLNFLGDILQKDDRFVVKYMNSWLSVGRMELTLEFFRVILEASNKAKLFNGQKLGAYVEKITRGFVRSIELNLELFHKFSMKFSGDKFMEEWDKAALPTGDSLGKAKEAVQESLNRESKKWVVLFIDDIDRLSYKEIGTLFQLVKNIADFPRIIYVLAYDKSVVSSALDRVQPHKGHEYMQKVVQVAYSIPNPDNDDLAEYLTDKVTTIDNDRFSKYQKGYFSSAHYRYMIREILPSYDPPLWIKTIRDCNRVFNSFSMKYSLCGKDCDVADLLAVTLLELYAPHVLDIIRGHKVLLCGVKPGQKQLGLDEENKLSGIFHEIEEGHNKTETQQEENMRIKRFLGRLFPAFVWPLREENKDQFRDWYKLDDMGSGKKDNIYLEDHFDNYFSLQLGVYDVSRDAVIEFLQACDEAAIKRQIKEWEKGRRLENVLKKAAHLMEDARTTDPRLEASFGLDNMQKIMWYLHAFSGVKHFEAGHSKRQVSVITVTPLPTLVNFVDNLLICGICTAPKLNLYFDLQKLRTILVDPKSPLFITMNCIIKA